MAHGGIQYAAKRQFFGHRLCDQHQQQRGQPASNSGIGSDQPHEFRGGQEIPGDADINQVDQYGHAKRKQQHDKQADAGGAKPQRSLVAAEGGINIGGGDSAADNPAEQRSKAAGSEQG